MSGFTTGEKVNPRRALAQPARKLSVRLETALDSPWRLGYRWGRERQGPCRRARPLHLSHLVVVARLPRIESMVPDTRLGKMMGKILLVLTAPHPHRFVSPRRNRPFSDSLAWRLVADAECLTSKRAFLIPAWLERQRQTERGLLPRLRRVFALKLFKPNKKIHRADPEKLVSFVAKLKSGLN